MYIFIFIFQKIIKLVYKLINEKNILNNQFDICKMYTYEPWKYYVNIFIRELLNKKVVRD